MSLEDYFNHPYRKGFCRFFYEDRCYYIPEDKMREFLLEDMKSVKYTKMTEDLQ